MCCVPAIKYNSVEPVDYHSTFYYKCPKEKKNYHHVNLGGDKEKPTALNSSKELLEVSKTQSAITWHTS